MDSIVAYTEEIDDLDLACQEIYDSISGFTFHKNSMALVFCEEETDYPELYRRLSAKFDFPFIGCTAMATLISTGKFKGVGISVMFLSADDCEFSVGISGSLKNDNYEQELESLYSDVVSGLSGKPKLMLTYGSIVNDDDDVDADYVLEKLDSLSDHIPICGALASDGFNFASYRLFCNDVCVKNAQVIALIAGNIEPKAICVTSFNGRADFSYKVTESKRNQVFRIGDETFIDALRKGDLLKEGDDRTGVQQVMGDYILSPFLLTLNFENGDTVEVIRNLAFLNFDNGSGSFLGTVPEGSVINITIVGRDDVQNTVKKCFDSVKKIITTEPGKYNTILCSTCCARFLALGSNIEGEAKAFEGLLPSEVSLIGIYSYGEFCPVAGSKTRKNYNMFHNFTFSLMLF